MPTTLSYKIHVLNYENAFFVSVLVHSAGIIFYLTGQFQADLAEKSVQSTSNTAPEYRFSVLLSAEEGSSGHTHLYTQTSCLKGGHGPVIKATGLHVLSVYIVSVYFYPVFRIRMFLHLLDPHFFVDPDPSINMQKMKINLDFYCSVTSL